MSENINIDAITVGDRLRGVSSDKVAQLAESIEILGLMHPIHCLRRSGGVIELVSGAHRVAAHRLLGRATICVVFDDADIDDWRRRLAEIDENLCRNDLTALEQGRQLIERDEILTGQGLRAPNHRPNKGENFSPLRLTADMAAEAGISKRTAQSRTAAARTIVDDVASELSAMHADGTSNFADTPGALKGLAKLPEEQQHEVVKRVKAGEKPALAVKAVVKDAARAAVRRQARPAPVNIDVRHCDALDMIASLDDGSVSLLLTDPPYNVTDNSWDVWDSAEEFTEWMRVWLAAMRPKMAAEYHAMVFCDCRFSPVLSRLLVETGWDVQRQCIWHRPNLAKKRSGSKTFMSQYEPYWHCATADLNFPEDWGSERFDVQRFTAPQSNHVVDAAVHPTQKPLALFQMLCSVGSLPGQLVVDPFLGSGTTALAAHRGGRSFIGSDQSLEYVEICKGRLAQ
jgi:DNA modification methylase